MARRRFFVEEIRNRQAELTGDDAHHLTRVLRVEVGQRYEISDNHNAWLAEVVEARKSRVVFAVLEKLEPQPEAVRITVLASLVKFDRFEWMLEKATELGVERIVPVIAERSERGLDRAAEKRAERWTRVCLESSQQSRRDRLPLIEAVAPFRDAISFVSECRLLLDESGQAPPILCALPKNQVALLVGPEGGWTEREREEAVAAGWQPVSLGPAILRAETAAIAAIAVVGASGLVPREHR
jgi:16S rRNA (uracil1498-N3)-methyltransferase